MALATKLPVWQSDLLDLSRANPLLFYKTSGRGAGIKMLGTPAAQLFSTLLRQSTASIALDWVNQAEDPEALERQLLRLRTRTTEDMRDRGLQTLYLAFGLLDWREREDSGERITTPLILLPVTLNRKGAFGAFTLARASDDDPEVNPVLREKMRSDLGITLPAYEDLKAPIAEQLEASASAGGKGKRLSDSLSLTQYLDLIVKDLPREIDAQVMHEAHLGRFSFQKLVMYHDLRQHEAQIRAHTMLRAIGGDRVSVPQPANPVKAAEIDSRLDPRSVMEILEADSSQQEAIHAARDGASFVLQGPPGTGKSQTIANIIAECLSAGEKVLFVSEKMAALEVVWKRLREAGLGDFLLNLHDPRQKRDAFLKELSSALRPGDETRDSVREWETTSSQLQRERDELNAYVRELHKPRFASQLSAFRAYGELARLQSVHPLDFSLPDVRLVDEPQFVEMQRLLQDLREHIDILDSYNEHPWKDTLLAQHSITRESDIRSHFSQLREVLGLAASDGARLLQYLQPDSAEPAANEAADQAHIVTLERLRWGSKVADHALAAPRAPLHAWLDGHHVAHLLHIVDDADARAQTYHRQRSELGKQYSLALCSEDVVNLRTLLTDACQSAVDTLVPATGRSAHNTAIEYRDRISSLLHDAIGVLADVLRVSTAIGDQLGVPAPRTVEDATRISAFAAHVVLTPRPPRQWLDPNTFPGVTVLATEGEERARDSSARTNQLLKLYRDDLFSLDVVGLEGRFRTQYGSLLRMLNSQYRSDARSMRHCYRADNPAPKRGYAEMLDDLRAAKQVVENRQWAREHRSDLAMSLGRFFDPQSPDWDSIRAAIDWTRELHRLYSTVSPLPELSDATSGLVMSNGAGLDALKAKQEALVEALGRWCEVVPMLQAMLPAKRSSLGAGAVDSALMEPRLASLRSILSGLELLWQACDTLARYSVTSSSSGESATWEGLVHAVDLAQELLVAEQWMQDQTEAYAEWFGNVFDAFDTDWQLLRVALQWSKDLADYFPGGETPESLRICVCVDAASHASEEFTQAEFTQLRSSVHAQIHALDQELVFSRTVLPNTALSSHELTLEASPLVDILGRVNRLLSSLPELERLLAARAHLQECRSAGLGSLLDCALQQHPFPRNIAGVFEQRFYAMWLDSARDESRELGRFSGEKHEVTIARYRALDEKHTVLARHRLRAKLARQQREAILAADVARDSPQGRALARMRQIAGQKRPRGSIRQIVRSIAPALLDLKPCWMMSPLSVSQFVEESSPIFDVIVFDEASQIRPEDAICAIMRGRRIVVVGDSKQLPPTQFFSKEHHDEDDEDDDSPELDLSDGRRESILMECQSAGLPERSLLWHYRSRHESLIAFSNHHFYQDRLVTFPNPGDTHTDGVRFVFVENGVYDFGKSRTNRIEAERIVDIIAEHLQRRPSLSLGVVALSAAQQEAIEDALDRRRKNDPEFAALLEDRDDEQPDGLFIKNLESVQGDERDVIVLSVGYGKAADGRLRFNFGPVNRTGGARRLNVAVTRAREQTILVSSIRALDIPASSAAEGVRILRAYLDYAERGVSALSGTDQGTDVPEFDSPFEAAVYDALTRKGLKIATQVGCSGYRIDLAVRDPRAPSRFALGIECDGRTYHSSKTARDRDRLRQSHLERMGWNIIRIWSSEWRRDPEGQTERILTRLREIEGGVKLSSTRLPFAPSHSDDAPISQGPTHRPGDLHAPAAVPTPTRAVREAPPQPAPRISRSIASNPAAPNTGGPSRAAHSTPDTAAYARPGTDSQLLHPVASWSAGRFFCETCRYFAPVRPGYFTCRAISKVQAQAVNQKTPCCPSWKSVTVPPRK